MAMVYNPVHQNQWASAVAKFSSWREEAFAEKIAASCHARALDGLQPLQAIPEDKSFTGLEEHWDAAGLPKIQENDVLEDPVPQRVSVPKYSVDDSISSCTARQRLLTRLEFYGLVERSVKGDGNCQFRALSDQLYGSPSYYKEVRNLAVQQLRRSRSKYQGFISEDISAYIDKMKLSGTWGDHITLQAIADWFGVHIYIVTSFVEKCVIVVKPAKQKSDRRLWLSFWAEVHYNSLYPESEPPKEVPREKIFGSKKIARYVHEELMVL